MFRQKDMPHNARNHLDQKPQGFWDLVNSVVMFTKITAQIILEVLADYPQFLVLQYLSYIFLENQE